MMSALVIFGLSLSSGAIVYTSFIPQCKRGWIAFTQTTASTGWTCCIRVTTEIGVCLWQWCWYWHAYWCQRRLGWEWVHVQRECLWYRYTRVGLAVSRRFTAYGVNNVVV